MQNVILSTRNIDDLINDVANKVIEKIELWKITPQSHQSETDELLTVQDAAKFLTLSVPTIYGLIAKNAIPCMKRSKRVYFSKIELINYLKQGKKKTLSEIDSETDQFLSKKKEVRNA